MPFAFVPFRQIGAGIRQQSADQEATWAASVIWYPTDPFGSNVGDDRGYGAVTRGAWLPVDFDEAGFVHVGGAYALIDPSNNIVRFRNQPEFFVGETPGSLAPVGVPTDIPVFVDTGDIATDVFQLFAAELAASRGPMHGQGEAVWAVVDRTASSRVSFFGVSVQKVWIVRGEHRPYDKQNSALGRIVPYRAFLSGCGAGAWEIATRWSHIDLNDRDIQGNRLGNVTLGVNWYLNRYAKFQRNYIHALLDAVNASKSAADVVALRAA